jgi:hypothetical protein
MSERTKAAIDNVPAECRPRARRTRAACAHAADTGGEDIAEARHREILEAIAELTTRFSLIGTPAAARSAALLHRVRPYLLATTSGAPPTMDAVATSSDTDEQRRFLASAFAVDGTEGHATTTFVREFDGIIAAAEDAIETVIANAELIDDLIARFSKRVAAMDIDSGLNDVGVCLDRIFEACSRQDVACQHLRRLMDELAPTDTRC